jgi:O-antigen/teichoic acid export membrane protein
VLNIKWANRLFYTLGIDKGLSYVTIGYFVSIALGAFLWFMLATEMLPSSYGSLNYFLSVVTISSAVGMLGFESTLTTFLAKGVTKMLSESVFLTWTAGLIISIVLFLIFNSIPLILVSLGMLFFILSAAEVLGKRVYREYMMLLVIQRLISLVSVPLLYAFFGIDGALYGYSISYFPLCYRFFASSRKISFSISTLRPIKNFFFHSYALGISRALVLFSDKLVIVPLFGVGILGYYQFGIQMLSTVSVIPLVLYHYLLPQEAAKPNLNVKKVERLGVISSVTITMVLIILTPTIISHLFPGFRNALLSTQVILLAGIPLSMSAILNSFFMAREKSFQVLLASAIFLGTQYALIYILGWIYGLLGLSLSTVAASTVQAVFLFMMKRKISTTSLQIS